MSAPQCFQAGTEGGEVAYTFVVDGEVVESGRTTSHLIVIQRFKAFCAKQEWINANA